MSKPVVSLVVHGEPPDRYGRVRSAVVRSSRPALLDRLGSEALEILQSDKHDASLQQLAYVPGNVYGSGTIHAGAGATRGGAVVTGIAGPAAGGS